MLGDDATKYHQIHPLRSMKLSSRCPFAHLGLIYILWLYVVHPISKFDLLFVILIGSFFFFSTILVYPASRVRSIWCGRPNVCWMDRKNRKASLIESWRQELGVES
ncbi:hypothetical protein BDN70DRAFT_343932 [Pholiota conissans]|uniref:Uncharacterized protein n=1 Tax=Pholiota conissans TaxID=109636 RepID=A0A9P6CVD7_9AGAR|nr:hypothetical protein BDN70DRAFT_343932 [Pholiota conissans]